MIKFVANNGDVNLQCMLGRFYMTNKDHLNYSEALNWYELADSNGNTDAIYRLGLLYENGQGTIQDYSTSYRLYSQAKEKGHVESIYRLGIAYQHGLGVDINTILAPDYSTAYRYLSLASGNRNSKAQDQIALMYLHGRGLERDYQMALKWFTSASESMNTLGCYRRGTDFFYGYAVEQDYAIAKIYLQEAAKGRGNNAPSCLISIYFHEIEKEYLESNSRHQFEKKLKKQTQLYYSNVVLSSTEIFQKVSKIISLRLFTLQ
jgi:TPR repeat protein